MSPALCTSSPTLSTMSHRGQMRSHHDVSSTPPRRESHLSSGPLAGYLDRDGRARELIALPGHGGSVLVLDRDASTLCDRRLVAHLAPDEPAENAALVCRHYVGDVSGRWCRRVQPEDLGIAPLLQSAHDPEEDCALPDTCVTDRDGNAYRLVPLLGERSAVQMRWCRRAPEADTFPWEQTSLRNVVGALQRYEPVRMLTERAIAFYEDDPRVAVTRLRCELDRLLASPVLLNRGLREAVLDAVQRENASMSEIALRCGVVKRDRRGKVSGETSWLARRIGIMPEGGERTITPWIHSDVLATIARRGLGLSPREVELR
jgi:hypothetical protein